MKFDRFREAVKKEAVQPKKDQSQSKSIINIPLDLIQENPKNTKNLDMSVDDLVSTIPIVGLINPITVYEKDDQFVLVSGERRKRAYESLYHQTGDEKYSTIPAIVTDLMSSNLPINRDLKEKMAISIPNVNVRSPLNFYSKVEIFKNHGELYDQLLKENYSLSEYKDRREFIARTTNFSSSDVQRTLHLSKHLILEFQNKLNDLLLTQSCALEIAKLDSAKQYILFNKITAEDYERLTPLQIKKMLYSVNDKKINRSGSKDKIELDKILNLDLIEDLIKSVNNLSKLTDKNLKVSKIRQINKQLERIKNSLDLIENVEKK